MIKALLFFAALSFTGLLEAADFEISVGVNKFATPKNGLWHQRGLPYELDTIDRSASVGLSFAVSDEYSAHIGYKYLGRSSSYAKATASDLNYSEWINKESELWPVSTWVGSGKVDGIYAILERDLKLVSVAFGTWLHRPNWSVYIPDWRCATNKVGNCTSDYPEATYSEPMPLYVEDENHLRLGLVFGLAKYIGNFKLAYTAWQVRSTGNFTTLNNGFSQELSIGYIF